MGILDSIIGQASGGGGTLGRLTARGGRQAGII